MLKVAALVMHNSRTMGVAGAGVCQGVGCLADSSCVDAPQPYSVGGLLQVAVGSVATQQHRSRTLDTSNNNSTLCTCRLLPL